MRITARDQRASPKAVLSSATEGIGDGALNVIDFCALAARRRMETLLAHNLPFLAPTDARFGDTFPLFRDGVCHLFALEKPSGPASRLHIAHYTSRDLVHWDKHPIAVSGGAQGEPDSQGCATGAVIESEGRFYLFYTGNQNICLATSVDLDHWTKHPANPILSPDGQAYTHGYFRDPFVFFHEQEGQWWMLLGSREVGPPALRAGCVGLAKSQDLLHWQLCPPLWAPRIGPHADCPQLLRQGERWYLLYLQRNTRYRVADRPEGPFRRPPVRDLCTPLAAAGSRPAFDGARWIVWPFVMNLADEQEMGAWDYGGPLAVPRHLTFHPDGRITERALEEVVAAIHALPAPDPAPMAKAIPLCGLWETTPDSASCLSDSGGVLYLPHMPEDFYFEASLSLSSPRMDAQVLLRTNEGLTSGYKLALHPWMGQVTVRPISEIDVDPLLVSAPADLDVSQPLKLRVFVKGSVLEAFFGERMSVTCRVYRHFTGGVALELRDGRGVFSDVVVRAL